MVRKKVISFVLIIAMVLTVWAPAFEGVAVAAPDLGVSYTALDISQGNIVIGANGASGGGLTDPETALNPDGYKITGTSESNTIVVEQDVETLLYLENLTMTTTDKAGLSVGLNAKVDIVLDTVSMTANYTATTLAKPAIELKADSAVNLTIKRENTLTATGSAGIGLNTRAALTIDGGSDDVLNATGGGQGAGIGNTSSSAVNNTTITINGGVINALGANRGAPGIGGYKGGTEQQIIINGGTIDAASAKGTNALGIGYGNLINTTYDTPIIINSGSVSGSVQGTPQNSEGANLRLVEATAAGMDGKVFTFKNVDDGNMKAGEIAADLNGKLYVYVPVDATQVSATCEGVSYMGAITEGSPATATLEQYTGAPCSCSADTATLDFPDQNVLVYDVVGSEQLALNAVFTPAEACEYPLHAVSSLSYAFVGDVASEMAAINGNILTVYSAAAGSTLQVQANAEVNGVTYTKIANITVSSDDAYVFDLAKGSIEIENDSVEVNGVSYPLTDTSLPVKIIQSGNTPTSNTITVGSGVAKDVIIENLNVTREKVISGSPLFTLNVGAKINLQLNGENSIIENADNAFPAISLISQGGTALTISGEGSLDVAGGSGLTAIGGNGTAANMGELIINGGRITARGGKGAAGLGSGVQNQSADSNKITINGGRVIAVGGTESQRDFKASVVINGGSVATLDASGAVSSAVRFDAVDVTGSGAAALPKNAAGTNLYSVVLSFEDNQADKSVSYVVNEGGINGAEKQAYTDASSKLYLYLPADVLYQQVVATPAGSDAPYYKRMQVSAKEANAGVLAKNPVVQILEFNISGQLGKTEIDNDAKTVKVTLPDGAVLSNLIPSVDAGGAEYSPMGAVDFSANNPITYTLIADDGSEVEYAVSIEQRHLEPGEKTKLDISQGDIIMWDDGSVTVGGVEIAPNSNGYVITGSSSEHFLVISDQNLPPLVFSNLTMTAPVPAMDSDFTSPITVLTDADITLEGVNAITGASGYNALYINGNVVFDGEGILKLTGGVNTAAVYGESGSVFVIEGGSVFINNNSEKNSLAPVGSLLNGEKLYPLEISVVGYDIAGKTVKYSDTPTAANVAAIKDKNYLADENGKISVYRPQSCVENGKTVTVDYDVVIASGDNDEYKFYGATTDSIPAEITAGLPKITELSFTPPTTSLAMDLPITLEGEYLGGDSLVVTATGQNGEKIDAAAVYNSRNKKWVATLKLPENQTSGNYTYTLSAAADGRPQTLSGETTITMLKELKLLSFKLDKYQLGNEEIIEDASGNFVNITVPYDVDLTTTAFAPKLEYTGVRHTPTTAQRFNTSVSYMIYNYESYEPKRDSRTYVVTVTNEAAPTVNSISFVEPGYSGGNVDVTLNGENFDNLLNAVSEDGGRIKVAVAGKDKQGNDFAQEKYLTKDDVERGINKVTLTLPSNAGGTQNRKYNVTVTVNGVEQTMEGSSVINVPGELEMNATIIGFSFADLPECAPELNLNQAVIDDKEEGETGTIDISVPWTTDLTKLVPTVTTANSDATYMPVGTVDFTNPVTFTVTAVKGNTKDYLVTVTPVASEAEKDPTIKSITVEDQRGESVIEEEPNENGLIPITITMPTGTDLSAIVPEIQLAHPDATYEPTGPLDFSEQPQVITVTAVDGTVQQYEITVRNTKKKKKPTDQVTTQEQEVAFTSYVNGYEDSTFRPNNSITRAEAAAMLARLDEDFQENTRYTHMFEDVTNDYWATDYIGYLFKCGVVKGTDGLFDADREITRMEFAAMLARYMELDEVDTTEIQFSDIANTWGKEDIMLLAGNGVVAGYADGTFRPNAEITRAEAVTMLNRLLDRSPSGEVKAAMDKVESPFRDLNNVHWAYAEIMSAVKDYDVKTVLTTSAEGETSVDVIVSIDGEAEPQNEE